MLQMVAVFFVLHFCALQSFSSPLEQIKTDQEKKFKIAPILTILVRLNNF
jgi:hypothetical protein